MALYNGKNDAIRTLINATWVTAKTLQDWHLTVASLSAAQAMTDNTSDIAELAELIEIAKENIQDLTEFYTCEKCGHESASSDLIRLNHFSSSYCPNCQALMWEGMRTEHNNEL